MRSIARVTDEGATIFDVGSDACLRLIAGWGHTSGVRAPLLTRLTSHVNCVRLDSNAVVLELPQETIPVNRDFQFVTLQSDRGPQPRASVTAPPPLAT